MPNTISAKTPTTNEEVNQYKRYRTLLNKIEGLETRLESLVKLQKQTQEENNLKIQELEQRLLTSQM